MKNESFSQFATLDGFYADSIVELAEKTAQWHLDQETTFHGEEAITVAHRFMNAGKECEYEFTLDDDGLRHFNDLVKEIMGQLEEEAENEADHANYLRSMPGRL